MNPLHMNVSPSMHSSFFELSATFGSYEPEMLPPTITKFSGFRFSSRAPNKADITFFPPGTTPADVKTILNCTFPSTLIGDAEDIALSFYPGQLLELRMVYPQYPNAELSIRVRVRGTFLMKGMLLKAAAKAVKCFYRTVQETIMKEDPRGCNSPRVPEPDNLKIVELQPVSAKDGIWNIVISMRR